MKKKTKKWLSVLLALTLVLSLTVQYVMAEAFNKDAQGTLKIENPRPNATYTAYKVLSATPVNQGEGYTYTVTAGFANQDFFKDNADWEADLEMLASGSADFNETPNSVDQLAAQLAAYVKESQSVTFDTTSISSTAANVDLGYYLILETIGENSTEAHVATKPILVSVPQVQTKTDNSKDYTYAVKINRKDVDVSINKTAEGETADIDKISKTVDQEYTFTLDMPIPAYGSQYGDNREKVTFKITDTLPPGLELVSESNEIVIKGSSDGATFTEITTIPDGVVSITDRTLTVDFSSANFSTIKNYTNLKIEYKAKLTANADVGIFTGETQKPNQNTASLTYSAAPDTTKTVQDTVLTYTGGVKLKKVNTNDQALSGAEFSIYKAATATAGSEMNFLSDITAGARSFVKTVTTGADGYACFYGLGEGTYYIKETKAPTADYVAPENPIKLVVTFDADTNAFTYTVSGMGIGDGTATTNATVDAAGIGEFTMINYRGFELPETGGMGTILFTAGGIALIGLAAFLFLRSRRKGEE